MPHVLVTLRGRIFLTSPFAQEFSNYTANKFKVHDLPDCSPFKAFFCPHGQNNTTHLTFSSLMNSREGKIKLACFHSQKTVLSGFLLRKQTAAPDFTQTSHQNGMCWEILYYFINKVEALITPSEI